MRTDKSEFIRLIDACNSGELSAQDLVSKVFGDDEFVFSSSQEKTKSEIDIENVMQIHHLLGELSCAEFIRRTFINRSMDHGRTEVAAKRAWDRAWV